VVADFGLVRAAWWEGVAGCLTHGIRSHWKGWAVVGHDVARD
jgi:hypothetical protein